MVQFFKTDISGCKSTAKNHHKLKEHCRTHTHERVYACSVCGGMFASMSKLIDHLTRQNQSECKLQNYSVKNRTSAFYLGYDVWSLDYLRFQNYAATHIKIQWKLQCTAVNQTKILLGYI